MPNILDAFWLAAMPQTPIFFEGLPATFASHGATFELFDETFELLGETFELFDETFELFDETFELFDETFELFDETFELLNETFELLGATFEGKWANLANQTRKKAGFCQKHPFPSPGVWHPCSSFRLPTSVSAFCLQGFSFSHPRPISGQLSKKKLTATKKRAFAWCVSQRPTLAFQGAPD
jgi:hypothetical protein